MTITDPKIAQRLAISAVPPARINGPAQLVSAALASTTLPDVGPLVDRRNVAGAFRILSAGRPSLPALIAEGGGERIAPLRANRYFNACPAATNYELCTVATLQNAGTPEARLALADLGALPWSAASDAERRVLLLRGVVGALAGRAS